LPISAFFNALRAFQSGRLAFDDLSSEIDRQLRVERTSTDALLEVLKVQQAVRPLPSDAHEAISRHITDWPQDPTVVTGARPRAANDTVGVGDILQGRFSLVAMIGEGGMSRVFKAVDLRRAEAGAEVPFVAVKVLTEPFDEYFGSMAALQREAHKLQSLTHPNIVRVFDCDRDDHTVFMTMEYLAGRSLQKVLRAHTDPPMESAAALKLIVAIGEALESAHHNHIVHGDLKPGNVIVTDEGGVKVIDFGMAQFIARADAVVDVGSIAQARPRAITPRYASPQMAAGYDAEPADDVYALACIAYEALSGAHPFGTEGIQRVGGVQTPLRRPPQMPLHQYTALARALTYERQHRTSSVREFLDELLATRRRVLIRRWLWAGAAAALLVTCLYALLGAHHAPKEALAVKSAPLAGATLRDCATCPLMVILPAGHFQQGGATGASPFELPQHAVIIGAPFAMSADEVTVSEFQEFVSAEGRDMSGCTTYDGQWRYQPEANWLAPGFDQGPTYPVTCVSWDDAQAYATWLSQRTGHEYRLPSASEWEYAARAGGEDASPWGADGTQACLDANVADQSAANRFPGWNVFTCSDHYVTTAPVGSFRANAFGLHDLFGNVFEWVADCWSDDYENAPTDGLAVVTPGCAEHEMRGGSWFSAPRYVTATYRNRFAHDYRSSSVGIRLVRVAGQ
jgi:formylglycine-generating enzyme required for sulfatase activity/predicted Ser/Thr protein kinase